MSYRPCSVPECEDRFSSKHRFPNPAKNIERFLKWIELVSNPKLFEMDKKQVYDSYKVCHKHFAPDDIATNMFLKKESLPRFHLPVTTPTETCERGNYYISYTYSTVKKELVSINLF